MRAVTRVNVEQAPKGNRGRRPAIITGKSAVFGIVSDMQPGPTGVVTTARMAWANAEQEKPTKVIARVAAAINGDPARDGAGRVGGGWARSTGEAG